MIRIYIYIYMLLLISILYKDRHLTFQRNCLRKEKSFGITSIHNETTELVATDLPQKHSDALTINKASQLHCHQKNFERQIWTSYISLDTLSSLLRSSLDHIWCWRKETAHAACCCSWWLSEFCATRNISSINGVKFGWQTGLQSRGPLK